jgi:hypothetical protein
MENTNIKIQFLLIKTKNTWWTETTSKYAFSTPFLKKTFQICILQVANFMQNTRANINAWTLKLTQEGYNDTSTAAM